MIDRYSTPELRALWSEASKYRAWLKVELAAMDAQATLGEVPREAHTELMQKSQQGPLDEAFALRVAEIEAVTRHDIVAFTTALSERYGEAARFVHHGLTSTDVVDTAQNLLLDESLGLVIAAQCTRPGPLARYDSALAAQQTSPTRRIVGVTPNNPARRRRRGGIQCSRWRR